MSKFETLPQLAKRWGVTRARVHQLVQQGHVPATRVGRDWIVHGQPERPQIMRQPKPVATENFPVV